MRCAIDEGPDRMPLIHVDDRLDEEPEIEVRKRDVQARPAGGHAGAMS
jgi:hypothetical protein